MRPVRTKVRSPELSRPDLGSMLTGPRWLRKNTTQRPLHSSYVSSMRRHITALLL